MCQRMRRSMVFMVVGGGVDTTTSLMGAAFVHLCRFPRTGGNPRCDLLPIATEFLRYYPPKAYARPPVVDDVELGCTIARATESCWARSARRDDATFPDADRFVIDQFVNRHLSFGMGIRCGSHLARIETEQAHEGRPAPSPTSTSSPAAWRNTPTGDDRRLAAPASHLHAPGCASSDVAERQRSGTRHVDRVPELVGVECGDEARRARAGLRVRAHHRLRYLADKNATVRGGGAGASGGRSSTSWKARVSRRGTRPCRAPARPAR